MKRRSPAMIQSWATDPRSANRYKIHENRYQFSYDIDRTMISIAHRYRLHLVQDQLTGPSTLQMILPG